MPAFVLYDFLSLLMWQHLRFLLWNGCFSCEDRCITWQGLSFTILLLSEGDSAHPVVLVLWNAQQHPSHLLSSLGSTLRMICLFKQRSSERGKERSLLFCNLTLCWSRLSLILRPSKSLQKALIIDLKEFTKGLSFFALEDKFKFDVVVNIGEPGLYLQRCHFQTCLNLFVSLKYRSFQHCLLRINHSVIRADGMY